MKSGKRLIKQKHLSMEYPEFPYFQITGTMLDAALKLVPMVQVERTQASQIDTLTGILGEFVFARYFYGDWRQHRVGKNKGEMDFPDIEIKTSAFPMNTKLHLLVREDYARKRKAPFYIQIIIDVNSPGANLIKENSRAYICGFATGEELEKAPKKDFGSKFGGEGGYRCHYIPVSKLHPIREFKRLHQEYLMRIKDKIKS